MRPGNIVGALANEVGLPASAIGAIDLRGNHSLVELPADLTSAQLEAAANAEINGRRLGLRKDTGRPTRAERDGEDRGGFRKDRGERGERGGFRGDRDGGQRGGYRKDRDDRGSREDRGGFRKDRDDRSFRGDRRGRPGGRKPRWGAQERSDRGARR